MRIAVFVGWAAYKNASGAESPFPSAVLEPEPAMLHDIDPKVFCSLVCGKGGGQRCCSQGVIKSCQRHTSSIANRSNPVWLHVVAHAQGPSQPRIWVSIPLLCQCAQAIHRERLILARKRLFPYCI